MCIRDRCRIPPVSPQDAPVYNRIFGYGEEGAFYRDRPVLFLDQAFQKQLNLPVPTGKLLERVAAACGPQNVALRLHPTRPPEDGEYRGCNVAVAPASPCPWEVLLLNLDLEDRIFVSVHSTACLTPKLVFDQEPTVILLYRLVEELFERLPPHLRPNEAFFQAVRDTYRRPERFLIRTNVLLDGSVPRHNKYIFKLQTMMRRKLIIYFYGHTATSFKKTNLGLLPVKF